MIKIVVIMGTFFPSEIYDLSRRGNIIYLPNYPRFLIFLIFFFIIYFELIHPLGVQSGDEYLIYNRIAKEELNNFDEVKIQPIEKFKMPREEQESTIPSVPVVEDITTDDQPTQKMSSISKLNSPKNKRKRARRKAGRWSR